MKQIASKWGLWIAVLFSTSIIVCLTVEVSLIWGLLLTLSVAVLVLKQHGVPLVTSLTWIKEGIYSIKSIYILILMIGMNVSMWIASGTVPMLIYYGFDFMGKVNFLPFAFLMTAVVALFLGTGLGTISTVGIALFALGKTIGIDSGLLVGALLSGAYVADRLSPISALVNFTLETVGVSFKAYFVKTAKVMAPMVLISFLFYMALGAGAGRSLPIDEVVKLKVLVGEAFSISPLFLLLPVTVLWISFRGVKSIKVLGFGITAGFIIAMFYQEMSFLDGLRHLTIGFRTDRPEAFLQSLQIGGMVPMIEVVFIVMGGIAMSTLYERCGWIAPITKVIMVRSHSRRKAIFNTGVLSVVLDALTCDQTVGILIPGKYLKGAFHANGLDDTDLAQVIANTGTAFAPLMPWNVNAIIILAITGVSAVSYAPYAIMNWLAFGGTLLLTGMGKVDK